MSRGTRVSLYSLEDEDEYLGFCGVDLALPTWLPFVSSVPGTLHLSTRRVIFDPSDHSRPVLYFPVQQLTAVELAFDSTPGSDRPGSAHATVKSLRFACSSYLAGQPNDQVGPLERPSSTQEAWTFRLHSHDGRIGEFTTSLVAALGSEDAQMRTQCVEAHLRRRETSLLQGGPRGLQHRRQHGGGQETATASFPAWRMLPLRQQRGVLHIYAGGICFDPLFSFPSHTATVTLPASLVSCVLPRAIAFHDVGFDVYVRCTESLGKEAAALSTMADNLALSLRLPSAQEREHAIVYLQRATPMRSLSVSFRAVQAAWQAGSMDNYEYLCFLNKLASRTTTDLSQYPVFPWVLSDFTSPELSFDHPISFRDLSKPVGALNTSRLRHLKERQVELEAVDEGAGHRAGGHHLYATHYSSAGAVAYYLVRPHPEYQLCLQHGRFDHPQRIFESLPVCWESVYSSPSDYKELIPEFFDPPSAVRIARAVSFSLGVKDDGTEVSRGLRLPPWAHGSAERFARFHRDALESDYVSRHLHEWIDLIFGVTQSGEGADAADNTFHPYTYPPPPSSPSSVAPGSPTVPGGPDVRLNYAREFGCTPTRLFTSPHPPRFPLNDDVGVREFPSLSAAAHTMSSDASPPDSQLPLENVSDHHGGRDTSLNLAAPRSGLVAAATDTCDDGKVRFTVTEPQFSLLEVARVAATTPSVAAELFALSRSSADAPVRPAACLVLSNLVSVPEGGGTCAKEDLSSAGETLMTMTCDSRRRTVSIFDCLTGERLRSFTEFTSPVELLVPIGDYVLAFTADHDVFVIRLRSRAVVEHLESFAPSHPLVHACVGDYFVLVDAAGRVRVWQLPNNDGLVEVLRQESSPLIDTDGATSVEQVALGCDGTTLTVMLVRSTAEVCWCRLQVASDGAACRAEEPVWRAFPLSYEEGAVLHVAATIDAGAPAAVVIRADAVQVYGLEEGRLTSQWSAPQHGRPAFIGATSLSGVGPFPILCLEGTDARHVVLIHETRDAKGHVRLELSRASLTAEFVPYFFCASEGLLASLNAQGSVVLYYSEPL